MLAPYDESLFGTFSTESHLLKTNPAGKVMMYVCVYVHTYVLYSQPYIINQKYF